MSRKIHHGPNGSYKTSGALNDDLMTAVASGRTIISNVRGLEDKDLIIATWYKLQPFSIRLFWRFFPNKAPWIDFELIYLDTEDKDFGEDNLEKMRRFAEWAPQGALIIFDEVDEIYDPQLFTATYLKNYDYPVVTDENGNIILTSKEAAVKAGRFATLKVAFSKHRHMNWDMIFTCTSIDNVHPMIRKGADMAYRHFNLANIGAIGKGKYREIAHSPDNRGSSDSQAISNVVKKIPKELFGIYKSTATGEVQDTIAGTSLWKGNFKLRFFTFLLIALIIKSFWDLPKLGAHLGWGEEKNESKKESSRSSLAQTKSFGDSSKFYTKSSVKNNQNNHQNTNKQNNNKNSHIFSNAYTDQVSSQAHFFIKSFLAEKMYLTGNIDDHHIFFRKPDSKNQISIDEIKQFGIRVQWVTRSSGFFQFDDILIPFEPVPVDVADFCCLDDGKTTNQSNKIVVKAPSLLN